MDRFDSFDNNSFIAIPTPTSFKSLPAFPTPNLLKSKEALKTESALIKQSGIMPGKYTEFNDLKRLISVHEHLWKSLEGELFNYDNLALSKILYQKLEVILGNLSMNIYASAANQMLTGSTNGSNARVDLWRAITPFTEGIKFLLEMVVKYCGDDGRTSDNSRLDYLIWLASRIVLLDEHLERIYDHVIPYEITITPDFNVFGGVSDSVRKAINTFINAEKSHTAQAERDFFNDLPKIMGPKVKVDDFKALPGMIPLDKAMIDELGYGIFDWIRYNEGCMSLFQSNDYFKVIGVPKFKRRLRETSGLTPEKVELILQDHALSKTTVKNLTHDDMMPMENYKRDSRLLRRPIIEIFHREARVLLLGIETFQIGGQVFVDSLSYGTLKIPRMRPNGPIKSALGILQGQVGEPFRDSITSKCKTMGFKTEKEWPIPKINPTDKQLGPVDILVIDDKNKRIVLVEAKNLQSQGIVPKEMKGQLERFLGINDQDDQAFIRVLKNKEQAFASNKEWHMRNLKVEPSEDYTVESVIVVFHPLLWPAFVPEPLPILDDLEFYKRLQFGQHFLSSPVI